MAKLAEFRSPHYPALAIQVGGRKYKFAGGRLTVGPGEADAVEKWAKARPHLHITRTSKAAPEPTPEATPNTGEETEPTVEPKAKGGAKT